MEKWKKRPNILISNCKRTLLDFISYRSRITLCYTTTYLIFIEIRHSLSTTLIRWSNSPRYLMDTSQYFFSATNCRQINKKDLQKKKMQLHSFYYFQFCSTCKVFTLATGAGEIRHQSCEVFSSPKVLLTINSGTIGILNKWDQ